MVGQIVFIESESKPRQQVVQLLQELAPDAVVLTFHRVEEFVDFFKASLVESKKIEEEESEEEGEERVFLNPLELQLVLLDRSEADRVEFSLWKKFTDYIENKKSEMPSEEVLPTRMILLDRPVTGQLIDTRKYPFTDLFNVIMKPIDVELVRQVLKLALTNEDALVIEDLYSQEAEAVVEMIKDIQIDSLTELGFRTVARREIPISDKARYFGTALEGVGETSVFAYCYANYKLPDESDSYSSSFSFFGISSQQLGEIRRKITRSKNHESRPLGGENSPCSMTAVVLSGQKELVGKYRGLIEERFLDLNVVVVPSLGGLLDFLPKPQVDEVLKESEYQQEEISTQIRLLCDLSTELIVGVERFDGQEWKEVQEALGYSRKDWLGNIGDWPEGVGVEASLVLPLLKNPGSSIVEQVEVRVKERDVYFDLTGEFVSETIHEGETGAHHAFLCWTPTNRESVHDLKKENHPLKGLIQVVFLDEESFDKDHLETLKLAVCKINKNMNVEVKYILISQQPVEGYLRLHETEKFDDVLMQPIDYFYVTRKLKMYLPQLQVVNEEDKSRDALTLKEPFNAGITVKILSISEVHISIEYRRTLKKGDMRRFVLWIPNTQKMPELMGVCRYSEPIDKDTFRCDFLFFGLQEQQLVYVRKWIKEYYVTQKSSGGE